MNMFRNAFARRIVNSTVIRLNLMVVALVVTTKASHGGDVTLPTRVARSVLPDGTVVLN